MSTDLQIQMTTTIDDIRRRAIEKGRRPGVHVQLEAVSRPNSDWEWRCAIGWWDGGAFQKGRFMCEIGIGADIVTAVQNAIDKIKPEPDLSEYGCPPPVLA